MTSTPMMRKNSACWGPLKTPGNCSIEKSQREADEKSGKAFALSKKQTLLK
jgi:hypothetical protein